MTDAQLLPFIMHLVDNVGFTSVKQQRVLEEYRFQVIHKGFFIVNTSRA